MKWAGLVLTCLIISSICLVNLQDVQATADNTWQTLQLLPESLAGIAVTVEDKIYIFSVSDSNQYVFRLFVYDPQNQTLTQTASMPTYRTNFGVAVVDKKIYTIGGTHYYHLPGGAIGGNNTDINEVYDTRTGTWETKQPTIDRTDVMIANAVSNKIYVIAYSHIDVYDPATDAWTRRSALPEEVTGPRYSCAIDDAIYVLKDSTGDDVCIGEGKLHIYNITTDTWSTGATLPTFYKHSRLVATTGEHAPKQIYLVGGLIVLDGLDNYEGVNATFVYDPAADSWSKVADMPTARYETAVAVVADKIYAIGGAIELVDWAGKQTDAVEVYTPFGYGTVEPSASPAGGWFVFPDAAAIIVGVAIGAAIAATVIAATVKIINHRKHQKQASPFVT